MQYVFPSYHSLHINNTKGFNDLETAILALCLEINPPKNLTANKKFEKHSAKFGLFWKCRLYQLWKKLIDRLISTESYFNERRCGN